MKNESLKVFVQKIPSLPTLPVIAQEILMLLDDDLVSVGKLESIIENDPAISVRVLSFANSAFWGFHPVKTLKDAIFRIGFNSVKYLAAGVSLMTLFDSGKHRKKDYQKVFNHSVGTGFIAKLLSRELRADIPEEILIQGMLHDIGIMVLNRYFQSSCMKITDLVHKGTPLIEAERTVLDFTHAEIGSWLVEEWNLPGGVVSTTLYHHEPTLSKKYIKQAAIVHLADFLTTRFVLGPIEQNPRYPFDRGCLETLGLSENDMGSFETLIKNGELFSGLFV